MTAGHLLRPLGWIYGGAAALRRQAYVRGLLGRAHAGVPVISIGALTIGGSGKSPAARSVAQTLRGLGRHPAVVHSGYGGSSPAVAVVRAADRWSPDAVRRHGDEPALLAGWLQDVPVVKGADRVGAARAAAALGADVVVLDDGFQHLRLHRDLDIIMDDGAGEAPVPAGRGREWPLAGQAADLRWSHSRDGAPAPAGPSEIGSCTVARELVAHDGRRLAAAAALAGQRVCLVAGIAAPRDFRRLVERLGAIVIGEWWVRDHHPLPLRTLRRAAARRPDLLLCTEKDLVRMVGCAGARDLVALSCTLEVTRGRERLEQAIRGCLGC